MSLPTRRLRPDPTSTLILLATFFAALVTLGSNSTTGFADSVGSPYTAPFPSNQDNPASSPVMHAASAAIQGNPVDEAKSLGVQATESWLSSLGDNAPDWLKRTEFTWGLGSDSKPDYSILTVQPLYQSIDKTDTVFIQASQLRYALFGDYRDTTNIGIGYRRLLNDNTLLLGANTFYDREWTNEHQRVGIGGEAKWKMLDFYTNGYIPLSGWTNVDNGGTTERAMAGWDAEVRSQLPYLPWANAGIKRYEWFSSNPGAGMEGWLSSVDMNLTKNLSIELGSNSQNNVIGSGYGKLYALLTFHLASFGKPTALSDQIVSNKIFSDDRNDLATHTLDKVRRENRIIVERSVNGVSVVVSRNG